MSSAISGLYASLIGTLVFLGLLSVVAFTMSLGERHSRTARAFWIIGFIFLFPITQILYGIRHGGFFCRLMTIACFGCLFSVGYFGVKATKESRSGDVAVLYKVDSQIYYTPQQSIRPEQISKVRSQIAKVKQLLENQSTNPISVLILKSFVTQLGLAMNDQQISATEFHLINNEFEKASAGIEVIETQLALRRQPASQSEKN